MIRKFYHPLWTHIPALLIVMMMAVVTLSGGPLPGNAPVHFGPGGRPDRFGSPWEVLGGSIALSVLYIGISILADELWARQEGRKTFNWMSLFDELSVGFLGGIVLSYLRLLRTENAAVIDWRFVLLVTIPAAALAVVLELLRPYRPHEQQVMAENTEALEAEVGSRLNSGVPMAYWETQNPWYVTVLVIVTSIMLTVGAISSWTTAPWGSTVQLVFGVAVLLLYGGLRTMVTPNRLVVRLGIVGIRLLNLNTENIADAEVRSFSPLREFGGYGIRINREMKAYFFRGNRGVVVTTKQGKKYLIGSDHPDRLAAVIKAVIE